MEEPTVGLEGQAKGWVGGGRPAEAFLPVMWKVTERSGGALGFICRTVGAAARREIALLATPTHTHTHA